MRLTQGTKTLTKYMHAFNNLSRYAPGFVDIEEKKIESFKRGLGMKLMKTMANTKCTTYNEFISDALTQENHNNMQPMIVAYVARCDNCSRVKVVHMKSAEITSAIAYPRLEIGRNQYGLYHRPSSDTTRS